MIRRAPLLAGWLGALLSAGAAAHPAPNSLLKLEFGADWVQAEYWVPVSELAYARAAEPNGTEAAYLLRHLSVETPQGTGWTITVGPLREETYLDHAYLVARLTLAPPAGASTRHFVLIDDTVTHEVRNHIVYVVTRGADGMDLLGMLQYPARRLSIERG